ARRAGGSIYGQVNDWVASVLPEECQLIFLPFLNGSNEDPLAKGTFVGLTGFHDRRHMLRAVYEGVVFSHLTHVNKLLRNRSRPASVRLAGGAANSPVWVQIFADALQIPVDSIEDKELGAQGAAMAAGVAAGVYRDYADAAARTVRLTGTVQPRAEYARHYQEKYSVYRDVVDRLNGLWERFAD
ncbi:MAG TPA: carbohydrate kinase, partial [Candidatus Onthomonas avicola]|nr:carbohydrate kinase [Candidatus Onthomonas avicola]